jgi:hypothetical protein
MVLDENEKEFYLIAMERITRPGRTVEIPESVKQKIVVPKRRKQFATWYVNG